MSVSTDIAVVIWTAVNFSIGFLVGRARFMEGIPRLIVLPCVAFSVGVMLLFVEGCTVPSFAHAAPCHVQAVRQQRVVVANQSAVILPQGFVAVPFAVTVAVPSYVSYQAAVVPGSASIGHDPFEEKSAATAKDATATAHDAPPTLVAQSCVKCHSGEKPKGGLDLSGELSPETRLKMIQRILADDPDKRMPKGKSLDPQAIGLLIQELSKQ